MRKPARLISLLLVGTCCSGCTTLLMRGGRDLNAVLTPGTPQARIAKTLGKPMAQVTYAPPVPAADIRELSGFTRFRNLPASKMIIGFEDYRFRGRVRYVDESMIFVNLLFPVGEIIFFPMALVHAIKESRKVHRYRVWYDADAIYCGHLEFHTPEPLSWNGHTILPAGEGVAALNAVANNSANTPVDRARAIFTLFAHHLRPGYSAAEVHRVLTDTTWLREVKVYGVALNEYAPVEMTFEDTVFCLDLFPLELDKQRSTWTMYLRLSGRTPEGPGRQKEEALAFLRGDTTLYGRPKLVEYALFFPSDQRGQSRTERFSRRGIHVDE